MSLLLPKRVKYRKSFRGKRAGVSRAGTSLAFGAFGLKALENCWITSAQIEASRVAITRAMGGGKMWLRIFPDKPVTNHGQEKTMGAGKGMVDHWVAVVRRGRIMLEVDGVTESTARDAMRMAAYKLPIRTRFVTRKENAL